MKLLLFLILNKKPETVNPRSNVDVRTRYRAVSTIKNQLALIEH